MNTFKEFIEAIPCTVMRLWQDFLDSLNSDGGHILLLMLLVGAGMAGIKYGFTKADDLFIGAFTALLILLKSAGSNKTRRDRPSPTETTSTVTATETSTATPEVKP